MPLAHYVTDSELRWKVKVTERQSSWPERDLCLVYIFLRTLCTIYELNRIAIKDVIGRTGFLKTKKGEKIKPDSLKRHILKLLNEGGIESPSTETGRKTFAINLQKAKVQVSHINHLLGDKRQNTTKKLLTSDTGDMVAIAAKAF